MSELQKRRYKEVLPEKTVERLKRLLNDLGIEVEEQWIDTSSVGTYSLRINVKGTNIGQNGKGMTKEYAMASGYAEFFERFQNGMFRFKVEKPTKEIPFSYRVIMRLLIPRASATSCCVIPFFSRSILNFSPNVILVITPVHKKFATFNCSYLLTKALQLRIIIVEQFNCSYFTVNCSSCQVG